MFPCLLVIASKIVFDIVWSVNFWQVLALRLTAPGTGRLWLLEAATELRLCTSADGKVGLVPLGWRLTLNTIGYSAKAWLLLVLSMSVLSWGSYDVVTFFSYILFEFSWSTFGALKILADFALCLLSVTGMVEHLLIFVIFRFWFIVFV